MRYEDSLMIYSVVRRWLTVRMLSLERFHLHLLFFLLPCVLLDATKWVNSRANTKLKKINIALSLKHNHSNEWNGEVWEHSQENHILLKLNSMFFFYRISTKNYRYRNAPDIWTLKIGSFIKMAVVSLGQLVHKTSEIAFFCCFRSEWWWNKKYLMHGLFPI